MKAGDIFTWERTFTLDEVMAFGQLSGDQGQHHVEEDEHGRVMVQGLLTASIGTKIGGDLNYIARDMHNEFIRPVFTGDTITCELEITKVESEGCKKVEMEFVYRNQEGKEVLLGSSRGIIRE